MMVRITTGRARGVRLDTLPGSVTRPTADRAKQAVFSMIQFELENRRVLDLFAGSGQMGLEAVSRGAASAVLVDRSREAVRVIERNIERTGLGARCEAVCADYADFLSRERGKPPYDIVFLDPPYEADACRPAVEAVLGNGLIKPNGLLVCESPHACPIGRDAPLPSVEVRKAARYGIAYITLLTAKVPPDPESEASADGRGEGAT